MSGVLDVLAGATGAGPVEFGKGSALYSWGRNAYGQLGLGNTTYYSSPKQVGETTTWYKSSTGMQFTILLKTDGTLWSSGFNTWGQLGLDNTTSYSSPKQIGALTTWTSVASGGYFSLATRNDGTLWSWGRNSNGELGHSNTTHLSSPKQVGSLKNWSKVSCGSFYSIAIKTDGTLWTWGNGAAGQLGLGNTTYYSSPKQVGLLTDWLSVSGHYQSIAVKTNGTLWAWGGAAYGTLGLGNTTYYSSPKQVGVLTTWSQTTCGNRGTGAVQTNGTIWFWGWGRFGSSGLGSNTYYSSPKQVGSLSTWKSVEFGSGNSTFGIQTDGTLWAWGDNSGGSLGLGDTINRSSPVQVGSLKNWGTISSGSELTIALTIAPLTVPDKPTNVLATAGDTNATVTFTTPFNGGSPITNYTVTAYTGGVSTGITTSGVTTSILVTGLTNGTAYTFTVKATNAIGTGLESNASSSISPTDQIFVDDVFSTYLYTGNGSTQTITNGIDLAGKGGMVWLKNRSSASEPGHFLYDTARGPFQTLATNTTAASVYVPWTLESFNTNGFTNRFDNKINEGTITYASWTFRKAAKFFDVVTYTGNGVAGTAISHNLGIPPGMVIIKCYGAAGDNWMVWHRSLPLNGGYPDYLMLNSTAAKGLGGATIFGNTTFDASNIYVGTGDNTNRSGQGMVAYLFAHDTSADGIIQCGSYVGTGSNVSVNLGYEPQWVMIKNITTGAAGYDWIVADNMRGIPMSGDTPLLYANLSSAENGNQGNGIQLTATGFTVTSPYGALNNSSNTYIYMAIRMPNKPPTLGTQVYNAITNIGDGTVRDLTGVGFSPDLAIYGDRNANSSYSSKAAFDKLRGNLQRLIINNTDSEGTSGGSISFLQDGIRLGANPPNSSGGWPYINWFFKRAPGFFDVVCYTGNGSTQTIPHSLGVVPTFIIVKNRNLAGSDWVCHHSSIPIMSRIDLNKSDMIYGSDTAFWNNTLPTASNFYVGSNGNFNGSGNSHVAYLFATLAGISKVGSYTGNGGTLTVNCGFTAGARFVLIKRTNATGDWYVWDTARSINPGNEPHLSLNSTAAEVTTDDTMDYDTNGFVVNQVAATNVNVSSATYIFLAIA